MAGIGLEPREGFEWSRVRWAAPNARRTDKCSYCGGALPVDYEAGFWLFSRKGYCATFCKACQTRWWGLECFDEPEDLPEVLDEADEA